MAETTEALSERLQRLERANRRMKLIGGALLAMAITVAAGPPVPAVLKARSFQLVDASGNVLASLAPSNGNGCLLLYDHNAVLRDALCTSADLVATGLGTYGTNGVQRTGEGTDESNTGGFVDFDQSGNARAFIGHFTFQNQSGAFVYDPSGAVLTGPNVNPVVGFSGFIDNIKKTGTPFYNNRILLGSWGSDVTAPDNENLYLIDANDVFRAGLAVDNPCCGAGSELMFFENASADPVGSFYSPSGGGGSYNTFDQNGNPTGHLP